MPQSATASELSKLIKELRSERQQHVDAIARIDQTFSQFGIAPDEQAPNVSSSKTPARSASKKPKVSKTTSKKSRKKSGRNKYSITGEESILQLVASQVNPSTKDINAKWRSEGRGGKADNTISKLVKDRKLKRIKDKNERGSRYKLA